MARRWLCTADMLRGFQVACKSLVQLEKRDFRSCSCLLKAKNYARQPVNENASRTRLTTSLQPKKPGRSTMFEVAWRYSDLSRGPRRTRSKTSRNLQAVNQSSNPRHSFDLRQSREDGGPLDGGDYKMKRLKEADQDEKRFNKLKYRPLRRGDGERRPKQHRHRQNVDKPIFSPVPDWPTSRSTSRETEVHSPVLTEFYQPPPPPGSRQRTLAWEQNSVDAPKQRFPVKFTSPPLIQGLAASVTEVLGSNAIPTAIQALSLKWLFDHDELDKHDRGPPTAWKQFLLASETGSGKSIAYLLPLLQSLKVSEVSPSDPASGSANTRRGLNPRALILAPTHELARQLSGFAKALVHNIKLRVLCASFANVGYRQGRASSAQKMIATFEEEARKSSGNDDPELTKDTEVPVDVVVATPMKLLEMVRGRPWDKDDSESKNVGKRRKSVAPSEIGLANVEWVVVDEADILFDRDFEVSTRRLLADISEARGHSIPFSTDSILSSTSSAVQHAAKSQPRPIDYPFHFILTSATIPAALSAYLDKHHPRMMRLASRGLHQLPKSLQIEYFVWSGGNRFADIERRIRKVWAEDAAQHSNPSVEKVSEVSLSKVLIFCNKSPKVEDLGKYLEQRGIRNVALSAASAQRKRGSNLHLRGFLRTATATDQDRVLHPDTVNALDLPTLQPPPKDPSVPPPPTSSAGEREEPRVMITTSLLSRGLDFSSKIRHVFIVDEPRSVIDFLHRAGRTGRAGQWGKVVIFTNKGSKKDLLRERKRENRRIAAVTASTARGHGQ